GCIQMTRGVVRGLPMANQQQSHPTDPTVLAVVVRPVTSPGLCRNRLFSREKRNLLGRQGRKTGQEQ
ncbi:MAG: hypothetical protein JWM61_1151, partial [Micrococcaceae bacterium]|nr:hypothetical protein [Micrococcaceae bacterium]